MKLENLSKITRLYQYKHLDCDMLYFCKMAPPRETASREHRATGSSHKCTYMISKVKVY